MKEEAYFGQFPDTSSAVCNMLFFADKTDSEGPFSNIGAVTVQNENVFLITETETEIPIGISYLLSFPEHPENPESWAKSLIKTYEEALGVPFEVKGLGSGELISDVQFNHRISENASQLYAGGEELLKSFGQEIENGISAFVFSKGMEKDALVQGCSLVAESSDHSFVLKIEIICDAGIGVEINVSLGTETMTTW